MLLTTAVGRRTRLGGAFRLRPLAALVDLLELVLHLRQTSPQLGILRLQLGVLRLKFQESLRSVHDAVVWPTILKLASEPLNSYSSTAGWESR